MMGPVGAILDLIHKSNPTATQGYLPGSWICEYTRSSFSLVPFHLHISLFSLEFGTLVSTLLYQLGST